MVPFRPTPKTPKGKIQWREVKLGILARLGTRVTRTQQVVPQLLRRRLVAVLGGIDQFIPHLQLEAKRQAFESAPQVIWLSDGGRGFWRVYHTCFAHCAYRQFEQQQIPLGSGMVESACKWLIQQRFKGVGMRWSEPGFNHLLLLGLAWFNQRFDALFPHVPIPPPPASPNP